MFVVGSKGLCGQLYHKDQMPENFHEMYIVKGYRNPRSSPSQCILSLFAATNETLNFWTHFLPSVYFMWILRDLTVNLDFRHDSFTWPLLAYVVMCCIYPLTSAVAHLFNTMSDNARHICFFLDYSAISAMTVSVAISYKAYCFPSELRFTFLWEVFIPVTIANSVLCLIVACKTRLLPASLLRKVIRLSGLGLPCIFTTLPIMYRLIAGTEQELNLSSRYYHGITFFFLFMSAFLYGSHLPERWFPGSFDFIGHSHQLFHVCTILGTMTQMQAILHDMYERREDLIQEWQFEKASSSVGLLAQVIGVNTIVVSIYSYLLYKNKLKSA